MKNFTLKMGALLIMATLKLIAFPEHSRLQTIRSKPFT